MPSSAVLVSDTMLIRRTGSVNHVWPHTPPQPNVPTDCGLAAAFGSTRIEPPKPNAQPGPRFGIGSAPVCTVITHAIASSALAADALRDPRVDLRHDDVANVLAASGGGFDAIMLDVDNGAAALTTRGNAKLYRAEGIRRAAAALRPGGRLAYWSAGSDPAFEAALRRAGMAVETTRVRAHPTLGAWHTIFVASRPSAPASG